MIVYGLFNCFRHESASLLDLFESEASAIEAAIDHNRRWDGQNRWGRVTNLSHNLGKCLRCIRVRHKPWKPEWYDGDRKVSYVYSWMLVIVPLEVKP